MIFGAFIILVQGWTSFSPWDTASFFQNYLELIVFPATFLGWWLYKRGKDKFVKYEDMDFDTDRYIESEEELEEIRYLKSLKGWEKVKVTFMDNFL